MTALLQVIALLLCAVNPQALVPADPPQNPPQHQQSEHHG